AFTANAASNFRWYNAAGNLLYDGHDSHSFTTPPLTATTLYSVQWYINDISGINGVTCVSQAKYFTVQVSPPPQPVNCEDFQIDITQTGSPVYLCQPQTVTLTAQFYPIRQNGFAYGKLKWYNQETGGQPFLSQDVYTNVPGNVSRSTEVMATDGATVWVSFLDQWTNCESPRVPYTFYIPPMPSLTLEYAYVCGTVGKFKANSITPVVEYALYKQTSGGAYTYIQSSNTGDFEITDYEPYTFYTVLAWYGGACATPMYHIEFRSFTTTAPDVTGNTTPAPGTSTTLSANNGDVYEYKWFDGIGNFLYHGYDNYTTPVLSENVYTYQVRAVTEGDVCVSDPTTVTVTVNQPPITYSPLYNSGNFTKTIDLLKPVGTIDAVAGTNGSGGATYNIPVFTPPGTNGLAPAISVSYSSQVTSGVVGYGWSINGLSVIGRAGKDIFHDGVVAPVSLTDQDAFTLNGMRLNPIAGANGANGTVYAGEAESFSKIISYGSSSNNPDWFQVIQKDGTVMEFGNSTDSRILSDNGNNVLLWQLNKIVDINGNYVVFKYINGYRDNRIDEIVYTGNANTGLLPYNSIKFNYQVRSDVATNYVAGASFTQKHLLSSITVKNEGSLVKTYQFNYGFDNLYSLLKEVVETGSDGTSLNSTIFLYSEQQPSTQRIITEALTGPYDYFAGDFNGDGKTDLLAAELDYDQGLKFHKKYDILYDINTEYAGVIYVKDLPGSYFVYGKESKLANFLTSDYDGDGLDDVMQVNTIPGSKANFINDITFNFTRSQNPNGYVSATYSWKIWPDHRIIEPTTSSFLVAGDFDGDGNRDIITILGKSNGDMVYDPSKNKYRAFIICPATGIGNREISNLGIGSYTPVEDITTTIADAKIIAMDFDGDGKQEVMASNLNGTYIFSIKKTGSGSTATFSASLLHYTPNIVKSNLVYPGDFNGDGKTDLLVRSGSWKIIYSTGKGFVSNNFTFNQTVNIIQSYADDKLIVSDFNGDGKSDILHGFRASSTASKFSLYYSSGNINNSFQYEQYDYANVLAFENGHGFVVGDFNGDGKSDLLNRPSVNANADFISFKPMGKERLLTKVADGHNVTYEFKYKLLTDNEDYIFYERTVAPGDPENHNPFHYVQMPVFSLSEFISPNGLTNGKDITSYSYKDAVIHRGKGFLGFKTIISKNNLTGVTTTTENRINTDFAIPYTVRQISALTATGAMISEKINRFSFVGLSTGA
ncbi:MAG TPA: FG-GAP-like repeat-containing protein, partial [Niastella sp.]